MKAEKNKVKKFEFSSSWRQIFPNGYSLVIGKNTGLYVFKPTIKHKKMTSHTCQYQYTYFASVPEVHN